MQEILTQVARAKRRLNVASLFRRMPLWIFAGLVVCLIGWSVPKIFPLSVTADGSSEFSWQMYWLGGGLIAALLFSLIQQWRLATTAESAAIEIDQRFGLKERISSALAFVEGGPKDAVEQCLVTDAADRAARVDVRDEFGIMPTRRIAWLFLPIAMLLAVWFVPRAEPKTIVPVQQVSAVRPEIKTAVENAMKKLEEKKKQITELGLTDLSAEMDSLGKRLDELESGDADLKREALVKLNELKDQLKQQQNALGSPEELKKGLGSLNDLKSESARELNDAMKSNDFEGAREALKKILDKMASGEMTAEEKERIAKDINAMANELKKLANEHEEQKKQLQDKIKEAMKKGDLQEAAKLQEQLDQKKQLDQQIDKLRELAQKMGECSKCMNPGGNPGGQKPGQQGDAEQAQQAQQALEDLMEEMEKMGLDQEALEALKDLEKELQECKNQMNNCQGEGEGDKPQWKNFAKGQGPGGGERDMEETDTGEYKSRVKGQLQKGQTVVTGDADGENAPGASVAEARELIKSSMSRDTDPMEDQQLQRWQRQHALEYFQNMRKGG